ncbi:hypothetical protein QBC37DRAFT_82733 [Rhypophila decipiens]|uniref:Uncharacterized protein n=1 Tax=Rhypophila decipiens TaxID=261697 RepID=A0AAN6XWW3_9PEZI|nr:hypothetical protein QBC37DRAFT_82733 [Rhypophila decipiens]
MLDHLGLRFQKLTRIRILQEAITPCPRHGWVDSTTSRWKFFHSLEIHDPRVFMNLSVDVSCYLQHQLNQDLNLGLAISEFSIPGKDEHFTTFMEVKFRERSNTPYGRQPHSPETTVLTMCGLTEPTGNRDVKHIDFWLAVIRQHEPGDIEGLFQLPEVFEIKSGSYNPYTLSALGQRLRAMYSTNPRSDVFSRECEVNVNGYELKISVDIRRWAPKLKYRDQVGSQFVGLEVKVEMLDSTDSTDLSETGGDKNPPRKSQLEEYLQSLN